MLSALRTGPAHRGRATALAAAVLALPLTACGTDETPAGPETAPSSSTASESTAPSGTAADQPAAQETASEECLVGSWSLDREAWGDAIADLVAADLRDSTSRTTGDLNLTIEPTGEYLMTADRLGMRVQGDSPGGRMRWDMEFDGAEPGAWSRKRDVLALDTEERLGIATVNELSIDGTPLPADVLPTNGSPWSERLEVSCTDGAFTARPVGEPDAPDVVFLRAD